MNAPDPAFIAGRTMHLRLRDGTPILVRPVVPDDKWRLQEGLARMSEESRYRRFMSSVGKLTSAQLSYFTEIDYAHHFAYVALLELEPEEPGVGVARYVRLREEPQVAEAAVAVVDAYHGLGAGTLLLRALAPVALENGIRKFRTYVLTNNKPMLDILKETGAKPTLDDAGILRADIDLEEGMQRAKDSAMTRLFRAAARGELRVVEPGWPGGR